MRALLFPLSLSLSFSTSHTHTLNSTPPLPLPSQVKYPLSSLSVTLSLDWKSIHSDTTLLDETFITLEGRPPWEYAQSTLTGKEKKQRKAASLTIRHFLFYTLFSSLEQISTDSFYSSRVHLISFLSLLYFAFLHITYSLQKSNPPDKFT